MEDRGEDSLLAKKAKKKRNVGKSCVAYGCVLLYSYYKYVDASLNKRISRHVTSQTTSHTNQSLATSHSTRPRCFTIALVSCSYPGCLDVTGQLNQ